MLPVDPSGNQWDHAASANAFGPKSLRNRGRFDRALIGLGRGQLNFIVVFGCAFGRDVKPIHTEDEHRRDERPTTVTSR